MRRFTYALLAVLAMSAPALAGKMPGKYAVAGTNPGGDGTYEGAVMVEQTADVVYRVTWTIDGTKYVGTGIGGDDGLAVAYKSGSDTGVAIFQLQADGAVDGVWTYAGGKKIGTEKWTRE